jgi:serine/threonine-protein kinase
VPPVSGQSLQSAQSTIEAAGLRVGNVERRASDEPQDVVLETDPAAGTLVAPDSSVNLVISSGPAKVEVPDVRNQQQGSAEATLRQQGFTVVVQEETTCDFPQGTVFDQNPDAGAEVDEGEKVVILVAVPPDEGCNGDG